MHKKIQNALHKSLKAVQHSSLGFKGFKNSVYKRRIFQIVSGVLIASVNLPNLPSKIASEE